MEKLNSIFENVATRFYKQMEGAKGPITTLPNRKTIIYRYKLLLYKFRETMAENISVSGITEYTTETDTILEDMILEIDDVGNKWRTEVNLLKTVRRCWWNGEIE